MYYLSAAHTSRGVAAALKAYAHACWSHRQLVGVLINRDLKIKYAQTLLGMGWTLMQPVVSCLLYVLIFSSLWGNRPDHHGPLHYGIYVFAGVVGWGLFQYVVLQASSALFQAQDLLRKLMFPRLLLLVAKAGVGLLDYALHLGILLIITWMVRGWSGMQVLLCVPATLLVLALALSLSVWLSALSIQYRDWQHVIPFVLHIGLWCTPIFYALGDLQHTFADKLLLIIGLNPLLEPIELLRFACIKGYQFQIPWFGLRSGIVLMMGGWGIWFFICKESYLEDAL